MLRLPLVILHHRQLDGEHFDLMLARADEPQGRLMTFRLDRMPMARSGRTVTVGLRLPDHRREFLHYEGPLTRQRGWVRRVVRGEHVNRCWAASRIVTDARVGRWSARIELRHLAGQRWSLAASMGLP